MPGSRGTCRVRASHSPRCQDRRPRSSSCHQQGPRGGRGSCVERAPRHPGGRRGRPLAAEQPARAACTLDAATARSVSAPGRRRRPSFGDAAPAQIPLRRWSRSASSSASRCAGRRRRRCCAAHARRANPVVGMAAASARMLSGFAGVARAHVVERRRAADAAQHPARRDLRCSAALIFANDGVVRAGGLFRGMGDSLRRLPGECGRLPSAMVMQLPDKSRWPPPVPSFPPSFRFIPASASSSMMFAGSTPSS